MNGASIALYVLDEPVLITRPLPVHEPDAPVMPVARKIAELFEPNVEAE